MCLKRLLLSGSRVASMGPLANAAATLEHADLRGNRFLAGLEGAFQHGPLLASLDISGTAVGDIAALKHCTSLVRLVACWCPRPQSIDCLNGLPRLRVVDVRRSGMRAVEQLHGCPGLAVVKVSGCESLESAAGLAGAPALGTLFVSDCPALRVVGCAARVGHLSWVAFVRCGALSGVSALGRGPRLRSLRAVDCPSLRVLGEEGGRPGYRRLVDVELVACTSLTDFGPLACARGIVTLDLSETPIADLAPFRECIKSSLKTLRLVRCAKLTTLEALEGAVRLESVVATDAAIASLGRLSPGCANLRLVDLSGCAALVSLNPLGGLPRLEVVKASRSGIKNARRLTECPKLRELDLHGATRLQQGDVAALRRMPGLRIFSSH